jgi:hypothetical protein
MMPVEICCQIVFGMHDQGVGGYLGACGSAESISEQCTAQPLPLETPINSQPAHANRWHDRVARQLLPGAGRKIGKQQAGRYQGVVASNARFVCRGHKTGGHSPANVLGDLLTQVPIQRLRATAERGPIMSTIEQRELERCAACAGACCGGRRHASRQGTVPG